MPVHVRRSWSFARLLALAVGVLTSSQAIAQKLTLPAETVVPGKPSPLAAPGQPASMAPIAGASSATPPVPSMGVDAFAEQAGPETMLSPPSGGRPFDPAAGNHIRATYRSETYGQQDGNLNLGTMKLWQAGDGFGFVDGQVTLNEQAGTGYNLGLGYRWMTLPLFPNSPDSAKIAGVSVWTDGTSVEGENFFPQVGVSLEYLGDRLDFRTNAYIPVGPETKDRDFVETGNLTYTGNFLANGLTGFRDTGLTVVDGELAGRIMNLDAWVFGGVYGLSGGEYEEVGGKVGLRGYATPDLLLSIAVTNDDLFDTNAVFGATWFIGRTRRENCPSGTLRDRFRDPVIRNDYVATAQSRVAGAGPAITDADGDAIRIVHVDSTAAAGGDGTFERPLNTLDTINANSQSGDIVLAHAGSTLGGTTTLRDNQTFLGEGGGRTFSVTTSNGARNLPETVAGALNGVVPVLNGTAGLNTVTLADNNRVQNLTFNGGQSAIVSNSTLGSANANLNNLMVRNTTGDGIFLDAVDVADSGDVDADNNLTETTNKLGNVVIDTVTFEGVQGNDIEVNAGTTAALNVGETITIDRVTTTRSDTDPSIVLRNTNNTTGDRSTINRFTYNGGTTGGGGLLLDTTAGSVTVTNSSFTGGDGPAVDAQGTTGPVSIGATNTITNVAGTAVRVNGNTGSVTVDADITTASTVNGGGVSVNNNTGIVAFNGDINANNVDAVTVTGARAAVTFGASGSITNSGTGNAVTITDSGDPTTDSGNVTFAGAISNGGAGQVVSIDMNGGDDDVTFTGAVTESGTDTLNTAQSIRVTDLGSGGRVRFNGQTTVTSLGAANGVELTNNDAASIVDFNNLDVNTQSGTALASTGGELNITGTGNTITTTSGRAIDVNGGSSTGGMIFSNVTTSTGPATDAVRLVDFNGTTTINDGTLRTTGAAANQQAVYVENSALVMNSTDLVSGSARAADVVLDGTVARTVTINDADLASDEVRVASTGTGGGTVNLTTLTNSGARSFSNSGSGALTANMTTVTGTGDTTMAVTGSGAGAMTLTSVNAGGAVTGTSSGGSTGNLTVGVVDSGNTTNFSGVSLNDQGGGNAVLTVSGSRTSTTGTGVSFASGGNGNATMNVTNSTVGLGDLVYTATNTGTSSATISGTTVTDGDVNYTVANTGTSTANITTATLSSGSIVASVNSTGSNSTFNVSGSSVTTGDNDAGVDVTFGSGVTDGDVDLRNNTVATADDEAFDINFNGGEVEFRIDNNIATNASALDTISIDLAGTAVVDATVTNNVMTNSGSLDGLEVATVSGTPALNLQLSSNNANSGAGNIRVTEGAGTISVFQLTDTFNNTNGRNTGNIIFSPNNVGNFTDLPALPALPGTP